MSRRVLVTRPQPGADATAARLTATGFEPVLLPLTAIRPLATPSLPTPDGIDALVFTSANGVRHAPSDLLASLGAVAVFTVGDETAAAARAAGFGDVRSADGDAASLAALIATTLPRGSRPLHLAGRERTAGFAERLAQSGIDLAVAEVYRAEPLGYSDVELEKALGGAALFAALVHSPRGGRLLAELARRPMVHEALAGARILCISANAAAPLTGLSAKLAVSGAPREDALLALLSSQV